MLDYMEFRPLVHIIDDDDSVRRSLNFLLRSSGYITQLWENGEDFLKSADLLRPACVLLDIRMPGRDGLTIQHVMAEEGFDFPVIVLTGHGDISLAVSAMKGGAFDFIEKPFDRDRLLTSLKQAFDSISDRTVLREKADWARVLLGKLTEREREVLNGLACGYPNKTIAYDLGISARTVEVYRANVMNKLDVGNFAAALRIAFAAGLGSALDWRQMHRMEMHARAK